MIHKHQVFSEPYGWWGLGWDVPDPLSIVDLLAAGNFDARTAAILWLAIESRASLIIAAHPASAGKTTTLTALSDFLPPDTTRIYLRGGQETFAWQGHADPARSYLLCNEISPHLPVYLWGMGVTRLFAAVEDGFGFGATMHADSVAEVVATLLNLPLSVTPRAIAHLELILTLAVDRAGDSPRRHLDTLTLLRRDGSGSLAPVALARWDATRGVFAHHPDPPPPGLTRRVGLTSAAYAAARDERAAVLTALLARGVRDRAGVRHALAAYRRGTTP